MELPARLGAVLCVIQLLLMTSSAVHRRPPAADLTADVRADVRADVTADVTADVRADVTADANRTSRQQLLVRDCSDLAYGSPSGVYYILVDLLTPTKVFCDMDDGEGWTVFQKRADILPRQDFLKDWESYKWGLGTLDGEFWWGLHHLWQLTSQLDRVYELRVDLWDFDQQTRYATYQHFTIASEQDNYRLDLVDYAGDAGDSLSFHNGMNFTTFDSDNDEASYNCASEYKGAWWYNFCYISNLNGQYLPGTTGDGVVEWEGWRNDYSLNATTMKIRPTKKL